jgi:hypothetical protein
VEKDGNGMTLKIILCGKEKKVLMTVRLHVMLIQVVQDGKLVTMVNLDQDAKVAI